LLRFEAYVVPARRAETKRNNTLFIEPPFLIVKH